MCERVVPTTCLPPNTINPQTGQCEPPETYKLTLAPNSATIEPGQSSRLTATVTKQDGGAPSKEVTVNISLKVDATSGGHAHGNSTRPRGSIDTSKCESDATCKTVTIPAGSTTATFDFNATDASGTHTVTASCDKCTNGAQSANVTVKIAGLEPIPVSVLYALQDSAGNVVGAVSGQHTDNHYLTTAAIGNLVKFAELYKKTINPGQRLYLNDASLEWGGLFDVSKKTPWSPPHRGHRRGIDIDIRAAAAANGGAIKEGAVPFNLLGEVVKQANQKGINAALHCMENKQLVMGSSCYWLPEARHFHVKLK
jgi:hypothetical protein